MINILYTYYTWQNIKKLHENNKFKISAPTMNDTFELPNGSYSVSDIQDYFEHIFKIYGEKTDNSSIRVYVNKIKNRTKSKTKTGHYLQILSHETMKLLGSTKSKITKDETGKNVSHLEITEVVLVHCNIVNNNYSHDYRVLYTFVPNKSI